MNHWIACKDKTPPEGVPVWLCEDDRTHSLWVGCYEYCDDDPGGWFYGNTHGSHYWDRWAGRWSAFDNDWDDDYKPTHWMPLPDPPK